MLPLGRFQEFIRQHKLFSATDKVLLAVSGGRDSVLMAYFFRQCNYSFGIAHCNFSLRGEESDADERFVRQLAATLEVPFHVIRFDTLKEASARGISTQMAARELRYRWFEEIRATHGYAYIATAHQRSDITETMLLNLVRGTGIAGLHGIRASRGRLVRPLLFLDREEVTAITAGASIPYRDDSSNLAAKYARNKIRLEVVPRLKELNQRLDETFEANSKRFAELEDFLNMHIATLRERLFEQTQEGYLRVPLAELKALQPLNLLLYELLRPFNFTEAILGDLSRSWDGEPGKVFCSPTHTLLLDREYIFLRESAQQAEPDIELREEDFELTWNSIRLKGRYTAAQGLKPEADASKAFIDAGLLRYPLKLRLWEKGDYFYPFGMKGKKKLSDFFTGLKLSLFEKERTAVLENGNGEIIWVVGRRLDSRYKLTDRTEKIFILEYLNE